MVIDAYQAGHDAFLASLARGGTPQHVLAQAERRSVGIAPTCELAYGAGNAQLPDDGWSDRVHPYVAPVVSASSSAALTTVQATELPGSASGTAFRSPWSN